MSTVGDVVKYMEDFAPVKLKEEWDNVGLMIGNAKREVGKIIVMLDLDEDGYREAKEVGADMIITHHPLIMPNIKNITDPLLLGLAEDKISVLSMHTNLDFAPGGVNQVLAETLGLFDIEEVFFGEICTRGGSVEKQLFGEFISGVKSSLDTDNLRYVGDKGNFVSRVCVMGGSGAEFISDVKSAGFDVFVTSDVKYHQAQLAKKIGLSVIDAGHFETENPIVYKIARYISEVLDDVEVITSLRNKSYLLYE